MDAFERHTSENVYVGRPGTYSIFGTRENTKQPEIQKIPINAVIGNFAVLAVNERPSSYETT